MSAYLSTSLTLIHPHQAADKISLKFSKKLTGKSEEPPRWRKCVGAASGELSTMYTMSHFTGSLANAVGSLYVTKYFNEDSKVAALEMVSEIR